VIGLHAWLAQEARRHGRRVSLPAALLLGRGASYAATRVWPVLLGLVLRSTLHAAELYLLASALPYDYLAPLLGYRTLLGLASTAQWGALEPLRQDVRARVAARQLTAARARIAHALAVSGGLGAAPLVACSMWVAPGLVLGRGIELFDAYAWACALQLALAAYARTFHSGVYACRRVYRPQWSFAAGDALSLGLIVLGFDALGAFSVPLAIMASAVLDTGLSLHYARRAYRLARLPAPRARLSWAERPAPLRALAPALANLSLQLDAVLVLVLLQADPPRAGSVSLAALYYVLRPLLGLSTHWVRVFYFDVSRLETGALRVLRAHLRRYLRVVASACALLVAALALLASRLLAPELPLAELACLLALVLARAALAPAQLEAFVQRRYQLLSGAALGFALLLMAAAAWLPSAAAMLALAALLLTLGSVFAPPALAPEQAGSGVCGVPEWLARVRENPDAQLGVLQLARRAPPASRVARALAGADPGFCVAQLDRAHLLLMAARPRPLGLPELVAATGGLVERAQLSARGPARELLLRALQEDTLPDSLAQVLRAEAAPRAELLTEFGRSFPTGCVLDLQRGTGQLRGLGLSASQLVELSVQLIRTALQRESARQARMPVRLAVFAPAGRARWVFVAPRAAPGFAAFRARVQAAAWQASWHFGPVSHEQHARDAAATDAGACESLQRPLGTHDL